LVTLVIIGVGIAQRFGQQIRVVGTGRLDNRDSAVLGLEDLHPTVVADDSVCPEDYRPTGADRNAGVLRAKTDDLVVPVVAEASPGAPQTSVDSKERIAIDPVSRCCRVRYPVMPRSARLSDDVRVRLWSRQECQAAGSVVG
jgi:hypothetical protein